MSQKTVQLDFDSWYLFFTYFVAPGLYGGGGASPWIWQASNTPASNFINWSPGQPGSGNDCGAAGADGSWFTKGCDEKLFGICEKLGKTCPTMYNKDFTSDT